MGGLCLTRVEFKGYIYHRAQGNREIAMVNLSLELLASYLMGSICYGATYNFIFKVRQMYNLITLIVYFHCPSCFEPLIWVNLQGHII
jgi:hypothetical protein